MAGCLSFGVVSAEFAAFCLLFDKMRYKRTMQATIPVLKALRLLRDLSLKEVGALCGANQRDIQRWENGLVPPEKFRNAYASALGINDKRLMEIVRYEIRVLEVTLK